MQSTAKKPLRERGIGPLDRLLKPYRPIPSPTASNRNTNLPGKSSTPTLSRATTSLSHSQLFGSVIDKGKGREISANVDIIVIDSDDETAPRRVHTSSRTDTRHPNNGGGSTMVGGSSSRSILGSTSAVSNITTPTTSRLPNPTRQPLPFPVNLPSPSPERPATIKQPPPRFNKHNPFIQRSSLPAPRPRSSAEESKPRLPPDPGHYPLPPTTIPTRPDHKHSSGTKDQPIDLISNSTASSGVVPVNSTPKQGLPSVPQPILDRLRSGDKKGGFGAHGKRASPMPGREDQVADWRKTKEMGNGKDREGNSNGTGGGTSIAAGSRLFSSAVESIDKGRIAQRYPLPPRPKDRVRELASSTKGSPQSVNNSRPLLEVHEPQLASLPTASSSQIPKPTPVGQPSISAHISSNQPSSSNSKRPGTPSMSSNTNPLKRLKPTPIAPSLDEESYRPALPKYPAKASKKRASTTLSRSSLPSRPARARPDPGTYTIPPIDTPMRDWPSQKGTYGDAVKRGMRRSATVGVGPTRKEVKAAAEVKKSAEDGLLDRREKDGAAQAQGGVDINKKGHWYASSLTPLSSRTSLASISSPAKVHLGSIAEISDGNDLQQDDLMVAPDNLESSPPPDVDTGIQTPPAEVLIEKVQNVAIAPVPPKSFAKRSSQVTLPVISSTPAFQSQADLQAARRNAHNTPKKSKPNHSPIVHKVTPVKTPVHVKIVTPQVTKSAPKDKMDLVAKILAASKISTDAAREAAEKAEIARKKRIAEMEAAFSEDEKEDEKYDEFDDDEFDTTAEVPRRSVRIRSNSNATPPPAKVPTATVSKATERGNTFFQQAERFAKKTFYLDTDDSGAEAAYPTPESLLAEGEDDEEFGMDVDGMSDIAPKRVELDGGLLADGRADDEERVVVWDGFWESVEVSVNTVLERATLSLDETNPLAPVLLRAADSADLSSFVLLLLSGAFKPVYSEGSNLETLCTWLYNTAVHADPSASLLAADTLVTFLNSLNQSSHHPFGSSSDVLRLFTSTLRSLGARGRFTGTAGPFFAHSPSLTRATTCSILTRLVRIIASKGWLLAEDAPAFAEIMLVLAVDSTTSSALAYSAEEALDVLWPVWCADQSAVAIAMKICSFMAEYPISVQVQMIHAISRRTALSRTIGRWMALEVLAPRSLSLVDINLTPIHPSLKLVDQAFETIYKILGAENVDNHLNCDYICLIGELLSDIDGLVDAGAGRAAADFDQSEVNEVRNHLTRSVKLLPSSLSRGGLQAENRSRLMHARDNIKILMIAAQARNRRKDRMQKKGLTGGEGRGGQMQLNFGKKVVVK